MYLLNRAYVARYVNKKKYFTFHNVSIKSAEAVVKKLHDDYFTFHNVSIKSLFPFLVVVALVAFTFHNVSIKSNLRVA